MTRQTATQTQQQTPTTSLLSRGGILQRKCGSCGQHTISGGTCAECGKKKSGLQRKLTIGASNDPLEQEADLIADQVLATPAPTAVNAAPPRIQRYTGQSAEGADTAPASVDSVLSSPGSPLEPSLQQDMEQRFGYDFSRVRVHTGAEAGRSARDVNANAYTVRHNVVFGAGQFAPESVAGKRLLAHELVHTIQQQVSSGGYTPSALQNADPSPRLEKEGTRSTDATVSGSFASVKAGAEKGMLRRQLYSGPNEGPPVSELPKPPIFSCGIDKKGDWVCKVQNIPGVGSTPEIPVDLRKIPDKIQDALDPNSSTRKGLADCSPFSGFTAGGSSEFVGQCCKGNESKKSCCPPNRISFKEPFSRCCKENEDIKKGICVKRMESGEPDLTLPSSEPLPMQDGVERTLPEGEEYA